MDYIGAHDELRSIYKTPEPTAGSIRKELNKLDGHCGRPVGQRHRSLARRCLQANDVVTLRG